MKKLHIVVIILLVVLLLFIGLTIRYNNTHIDNNIPKEIKSKLIITSGSALGW